MRPGARLPESYRSKHIGWLRAAVKRGLAIFITAGIGKLFGATV